MYPNDTHNLKHDSASGEDLYCTMTVTKRISRPYRVEMELNRVKTCMKVEPRAAVTILNQPTHEQICGNQQSQVQLISTLQAADPSNGTIPVVRYDSKLTELTTSIHAESMLI